MTRTLVAQDPGKRTYIIGDLHGCPNETAILLSHLEKEEGLSQEDKVIFLGDYIDRGPNSKDVIELMLEFRAKFPETKFLKGNHEDMLLDFLGYGGNLGQAFLYNGGLETIQSYGMSVFSPPAEIALSIPKPHLEFFMSLERMLVFDRFICVHAGLNPDLSIFEQVDGDLFWIRDEFLNSGHGFRKTVIFGHTPHQEMFIHFPYKIGLDTGLVFGNKLSCLEMNSGKVFQVRRDSRLVMHAKLNMAALASASGSYAAI